LARDPSYIERGHVAQHFETQFGLVRHFGTLRDAEQESVPKASHVDVGVLFALQPKVHQLIGALEQDRGGGAWISWNLTQHLSLDTTTFYLPHNDGTINVIDGGPALESYAGIKAGIRRDRLGIFAKVRPGLIVFSNVLDSETIQDGYFSSTHSESPNLALDTGGVIEVYPSAHTILRVEAGDSTIFYHQRTTKSNGQTVFTPSSQAASPLLVFGAGLRF
jgi:hypothetical protein